MLSNTDEANFIKQNSSSPTFPYLICHSIDEFDDISILFYNFNISRLSSCCDFQNIVCLFENIKL